MKIAINGDIIDTKDIYKIRDITTKDVGHLNFRFVLHLFNGKYIDIKLYSNTYFNGNAHSSIKTKNGTINNHNTGTLKDCISSDEYKAALNKISKFRDQIIKIWSENQSDIPQFNLT